MPATSGLSRRSPRGGGSDLTRRLWITSGGRVAGARGLRGRSRRSRKGYGMDVTLTGYRLRPATTAPDGSTRWIGTRESDGTRVAVLVRPGEEDDRAGYAGLHLPGVLTLAEVHAVPGGCALLYADPPAHTLEDLIADGPICASGVVEVLLTLQAALVGLAGRGQGHPVLDAGGVWVDADASVLLGDVGGWPADPDPVAAQRCLLQLGTTLLADVAPLDAGVARLGLDAVEEVRRELADALVRWQHQVETSGQPLDDFEQRLRAVCEPAPPRIPAVGGRQASDLAGMLRALARADDPDPGSRSRFSSARFTIRPPRAGATTTAGEGPPVHSATAAPARRGRRAGRRPEAGSDCGGPADRRPGSRPGRRSPTTIPSAWPTTRDSESVPSLPGIGCARARFVTSRHRSRSCSSPPARCWRFDPITPRPWRPPHSRHPAQPRNPGPARPSASRSRAHRRRARRRRARQPAEPDSADHSGPGFPHGGTGRSGPGPLGCPG